MLISSSEFSKRIKLLEPDLRLELFNILNLLTLFCVFFLLNSRFILSPGTGISIPVSENLDRKETIGVITAQSDKFVILNGNIFSLDTLEYGIKKYLRGKKNGNSAKNVVLIRADRSLPVGVLVKICEIAKKSGYSSVQIAASPLIVR
jgi:biopolymer transport protein ExbD